LTPGTTGATAQSTTQANVSPDATKLNIPTRTPSSVQTASKKSGGPTVYAEGENDAHKPIVVVYGNGGSTFLRTIKQGAAIAADSSGYVYIAHNPVTVYTDQGKTLVQKFPVLNGPGSNVIAADGLGNFYVICGHKPYKTTLCEYTIGKQGPVRQLDATAFGSIATDASGNVYLGIGYNDVVIYGPSGTSPLRTISSSIAGPRLLAVDPQGNLFVANTNSATSSIPDIVVYAAGASIPSRTITDGVNSPYEIQIDSSGNLGLINGYNGTAPPNVTIYAPGSSSPLKVITNNIDGPTSLAFDQSDNLYVVNSGSSFRDPGNITVYAAASYSVTRTITKKLNDPLRVAVGP